MTQEATISAQGIRKIEALILMTKPEITMTTNVQVERVQDFSVSNEVINIQCGQECASGKLSAMRFLVAGSDNDLLVEVMDFIYGLIDENLSDYDVWLFLGNSAWQPDTRIVRYRKLWGMLRFQGIEILDGDDSQESLVEFGGKLKFFGAIRLSRRSVMTAVNAILDERCSYIAALPKGVEIKKLLDVGWSGSATEDCHFYCCIFEVEGLLFRRIGEFDDRERGFVSFGSSGLIDKLLG